MPASVSPASSSSCMGTSCTVSDSNDSAVTSSYMSEREFIEFKQDGLSEADSEQDIQAERDAEERHPTGKRAYMAACSRLMIAPSSYVLDRLSSDRLSLRHLTLSPRAAAALSESLSVNRYIRSLNLASIALGDESAQPLLKALAGNSCLTRLDLSRNSLGIKFGRLLAETLTCHLSALREVVLAEIGICDHFIGNLHEGVQERKLPLPWRDIDISGNKITNRSGPALASILSATPSLVHLNISWNDLRAGGAVVLARGALVRPGHLVSLQLSFNGLTDTAGVAIGGMLSGNVSLAVLDLSRNRLGGLAALSIAKGLRQNGGLRTMKLGWNALGREGTLAIIRAIGDNQGSLQVVRIENTTLAGMEFEAACEAEAVLAKREGWVEVVCEYPERARTTGDSDAGPVSWMTEHIPRRNANTTYQTQAETEAIALQEQRQLEQQKRLDAMAARAKEKEQKRQRPASGVVKATTIGPRTNGQRPKKQIDRQQRAEGSRHSVTDLLALGPHKQAMLVPVLSVRMKLRAIEDARLAAERQAAVDALLEAARQEAELKAKTRLNYLSPRNPKPRERQSRFPDSETREKMEKDKQAARVEMIVRQATKEHKARKKRQQKQQGQSNGDEGSGGSRPAATRNAKRKEGKSGAVKEKNHQHSKSVRGRPRRKLRAGDTKRTFSSPRSPSSRTPEKHRRRGARRTNVGVKMNITAQDMWDGENAEVFLPNREGTRRGEGERTGGELNSYEEADKDSSPAPEDTIHGVEKSGSVVSVRLHREEISEGNRHRSSNASASYYLSSSPRRKKRFISPPKLSSARHRRGGRRPRSRSKTPPTRRRPKLHVTDFVGTYGHWKLRTSAPDQGRSEQTCNRTIRGGGELLF